METNRKLSDESDYVQILDGQELRKKAIGLHSKQGATDQIRDLLSQAITKFKTLVEDPNFKSKPEYNSAVFEYANTLVTKAEIERELRAIEGARVDTWNIVEQASSLLKQLPTDSTNAEILRLQGKILFEKAKREQDQNELKESEQTLMLSCEKLLEAFQKQTDDQNTTKLLESVLEVLTNGKKDRKKQGKAVYQCSGEFLKQGTMLKSSYKQYFVVVEESTMNLYKSKKDWENGPVVGVRKVAPHSVTFSEVQSICACKLEGNAECTVLKSPKYTTHCLHVIRAEKPIHLFLTQEGTTQDFEEFATTLKFAHRMYRVKREVKNVLNGGQTSLDDLLMDKKGSSSPSTSATSSLDKSNSNNNNSAPLSPRGIIKPKGKTSAMKRRVSWSERAEAIVSEDEADSEDDSNENSDEEDDESDIDDEEDDDDNPFFAVSIDSPLKHEEQEEKDKLPVVEIKWKDFTPHKPILTGRVNSI